MIARPHHDSTKASFASHSATALLLWNPSSFRIPLVLKNSLSVVSVSSIGYPKLLRGLLRLVLQPMEIRESAMSPRLGIGSEAEKLSSPRTPKKPSLPAEDKVEADFASKEEAFFDLQGWLDSDSEDDFVSVNGDSTPFSFGTNKAFSADTFTDATSQPSSTVANGKLVDLLQENPSPESEINGKPEFSEIDATLLPGIPHDGTSHVAAVGTPSKDEKSGKCCLLPLLCRLSFKEKRKQKMMSSFH